MRFKGTMRPLATSVARIFIGSVVIAGQAVAQTAPPRTLGEIVVRGAPARQILRQAAARGAGLVVVGVHRGGGDLPLALAGFRLGPEAVERHGGVPAYSDMRAYLPKVMGYYDEFRAAGTFGRPTGPRNGPAAITDREGRC